MKVFLDIETAPGDYPWRIEQLAGAVSPPSNYKSEEAIKGWWEREGNEKVANIGKSLALSPLYGRILCVGWMTENETAPTVASVPEFMAAMKDLAEGAGILTFVGHNIRRFDLPYLRMECVKLGISHFPLPNIVGFTPWVVDTWELTGGRDFGGNSLANLCKLFGIENPHQDKDVTDTTSVPLDQLMEWCANDVRMTKALYEALVR